MLDSRNLAHVFSCISVQWLSVAVTNCFFCEFCYEVMKSLLDSEITMDPSSHPHIVCTEMQENWGLGCVNQARTRARVMQPSPHIFLHFCTCFVCNFRRRRAYFSSVLLSQRTTLSAYIGKTSVDYFGREEWLLFYTFVIIYIMKVEKEISSRVSYAKIR